MYRTGSCCTAVTLYETKNEAKARKRDQTMKLPPEHENEFKR